MVNFEVCPEQSRRIALHTFGCRLNQSETAAIENSLAANGFRIVDVKEPADVIVINTCTVTENGDADTRRFVNKINRLNPRARIALIGCQAQIQKEKLTELPNVHWVVGNARKMELAEILSATWQRPEPQVIAPTIDRVSFTVPVAGVDRQHTRANLKIQDGCDFFCSFCEIPYARGRARSREFDDILKEARILAESGHRELVITGINVGTYNYEGKTLMDVLAALEKIAGLERLRISSIEPTTIPFELIARMGRGGKLCRYLHIPLQSGDDAVLHAMKRKYSTGEFLQFIRRAKETVDGLCIGTDVIVGFPGENESSFERTFNFLLEAPVDYFHVFSYSARPTAKAKKFDGQIPAAIIHERSRRLRELSQRKRRMFYESLVGNEETVLFEQQKAGEWLGLTDHYVRVKVRSDDRLGSTMWRVKFLQADRQAIKGEIIATPSC